MPSFFRSALCSSALSLCLVRGAATPWPAFAQTPPDSATLILLGTGTPVPNPEAQGPAVAVTAGPRIFLFDAGAGVMRQLAAAGLPYRGGPITGLFLTHLHSDHTLGVPDVILTSWVMGRRLPLPVAGPPGTADMTDHLLSAWREDITVRTEGLERGIPGGHRVTVTETRGGVVYDSAGVRITAIPVPHGSLTWSLSYRLDTPGKTMVISGDTRPSDALAEAARGADVLVHEVYPESRLQPEPRPGGEDWVSYMRSFHTSDRELGALAARARPRLLVLYHVVRMGGTDDELLAGVRRGGFTGRVVVGKDLDRF